MRSYRASCPLHSVLCFWQRDCSPQLSAVAFYHRDSSLHCCGNLCSAGDKRVATNHMVVRLSLDRRLLTPYAPDCTYTAGHFFHGSVTKESTLTDFAHSSQKRFRSREYLTGEATDPRNRPYLVMLKGAPIYHDGQIAFQAEALSQDFDGEFWFGAPSTVNKRIGTFRLRGVEMHRNGWLSQMRFLLPTILKDLEARKAAIKDRPLHVIAYDPLTQGMLGVVIARRLQARLIVELPGVYADPEHYMDGYKNWIERTLLRRRNLAVAQLVCSRADAVRQIFPLQAERFLRLRPATVLENYFDAVPLNIFQAQQGPKVKLALFVGTPFHRKGVDILFDAWIRISAKHPDWSLRLIGYDLQSFVNKSLAQIHRIEVSPPGPVAPVMGIASLFVLPSRSDALPRVLIEAAAAGATRIGSRTGGIPRLIKDGVDGMLFENGNVADLGSALDLLMADQDLRERLATAASARIKSEFSAERYAADMKRCVLRIRESYHDDG